MKKIYIDNRNCLNNNLIEKDNEIFITNDINDSDIIISQNTVNNINFLTKTILILSEPPLSSHRKWCYSNMDKFKLVICHNPDKNKKNQMPFTDDNSPQYFPYNPNAYLLDDRKNTTFRNKGIFFAGNKNVSKHKLTNESINPLREMFGCYFKKKLPQSKFIGIGWDDQKNKIKEWRSDKIQQIIKSECDFVLALENTIYPNYISEKIWDGINSDRVTLYLGDPYINEHIPTNCFIDLRKYYKNKKIDLDSIYDLIINMSQDEYNNILFNSRKFKKTTKGKHTYYSNKLTLKIINYIKKY